MRQIRKNILGPLGFEPRTYSCPAAFPAFRVVDIRLPL